ncbi:MAG: HNH endonuclease [Porphyrobacter sp. IPPAS B-1204]|nr:MAG: HNH endonuclease [Porphyrobacter sp. IPPAS B-1204]
MTNPLSLRDTKAHPIFRVELDQAAFNHGFRKANGVADGWLWFKSDEGVPGEVAVASGINSDGSPWFLAVEHAGVAAKLAEELAEAAVSPPAHFKGAFAFATQAELRSALSRAFHLARSLPTFPLAQYEAEVAGLGNTEVERIVKERVGQGYFRRALMDYWGGRCPLTGIRDEALLRASHIVPWAECRSDEERLDVFNGLLLAVHWDAAFDRGLVSFNDDGKPLIKQGISADATALLVPNQASPIPLDAKHRRQLAWHRHHFGLRIRGS